MESLQTIIATCAPEAGLSSHIVPFASGSSLKERLSANPVLMAPMAGVSDGVYRTMARAGLHTQKWFLSQEFIMVARRPGSL